MYQEKHMPTDTREILLEILPNLGVAHHLPGRIRLQLLPGRVNTTDFDDATISHVIQSLHLLFPGIRSLKLNKFARSILLIYSPSIYPFELVEDLFRSGGGEHARYLLDSMCQPTNPDKGEPYE